MKSTESIIAIYDQYAAAEEFTAQLVNYMNKPALQRGATWLLKHHLEITGNTLAPPLNDRVYAHVSTLDHWEAKLHILQCMSQLPISNKCVSKVETFLRNCLANKAKFVRAWAYSGFHLLATQHPQFQQEAELLFDQALQHETAGSVKVRVRRAIKLGF